MVDFQYFNFSYSWQIQKNLAQVLQGHKGMDTYICSKAVTIQWTVVESESQNPRKTDLTFQ